MRTPEASERVDKGYKIFPTKHFTGQGGGHGLRAILCTLTNEKLEKNINY